MMYSPLLFIIGGGAIAPLPPGSTPLSACIQVATDHPKTSQSSNILGWNMQVEESKKTSLFWHDIWRINSSPRQGTIVDIMRCTRAKYHYQDLKAMEAINVT